MSITTCLAWLSLIAPPVVLIAASSVVQRGAINCHSFCGSFTSQVVENVGAPFHLMGSAAFACVSVNQFRKCNPVVRTASTLIRQCFLGCVYLSEFLHVKKCACVCVRHFCTGAISDS